MNECQRLRNAQGSFCHRIGRICWLALLVPLFGCTSSPDGLHDGLAIHHRLIEEDPQELLYRHHMLRRTRLFEWKLQTAEDLESWSARDGQELSLSDRGLAVEVSPRPFRLGRKVDLDAAEVDALEVVVTGIGRGNVALRWARQEERLSGERKISLRASTAVDGTYTFELARHPRWDGRVRKIDLRFTSSGERKAKIQRVAGLQDRPDDSAVKSVLQRPWKIDLDSDVRNALLAPPGIPFERAIRVPREGKLAFAYGLDPYARQPVEFTVSISKPGQEPSIAWSDSIQPSDQDESAVWHHAELDLKSLKGETVNLTLETSSERPWDLAEGLPYWGNPEVLGRATEPSGPNVVLISIDTLRADHLSLYGYARPTSPNIDAWAKRSGIAFLNVVASAPWTFPSHVSLFTGIDAVRHGVNYRGAAPASFQMLAERFRENGYTTLGFTAGAYLNPKFGFTQGFDVYRIRQPGPTAADSSDELATGMAELQGWLESEQSRPFFAFFHTYEVHVPLWIRDPYFRDFGGDPEKAPFGYITTGTFGGPDEERLVATKKFVQPVAGRHEENQPLDESEMSLVVDLYDSAVAYTDAYIGRLLDFLDGRSLLRNTVVALTSDHGEALGEHGLAAHGYLYEDNLRVPLILWLPGSSGRGRLIPDQVRSIDIAPTLLDLAGLAPLTDADGVSLRQLVETGDSDVPREAWSFAPSTNRGISLRLGNRLKFIFANAAWDTIHGAEEIYDLKADPKETVNLADDSPDLEALRSRIREKLSAATPGLRIRFSNPNQAVIRGTIHGPQIRRSGVTSPDLACRCVEFDKNQALRFEVPAEESYTLFLEHPDPDRLQLQGRIEPDGVAFSVPIDVGGLAQPYSLTFQEGNWIESSVEIPGELREVPEIVVWREGEAQAADDSLVEGDAELIEQLRALGYIN